MPNQVSPTAEPDALVGQEVASGLRRNASEVVRAALPAVPSHAAPDGTAP